MNPAFKNIVGINLLIMVGYSLTFFVAGTIVGDNIIPVQWGTIIAHCLILLVLAVVRFFSKDSGREGLYFLLAFLVVLLPGHGFCFFNGLMNLRIH